MTAVYYSFIPVGILAAIGFVMGLLAKRQADKQ